jgi:hypothetical protein
LKRLAKIFLYTFIAASTLISAVNASAQNSESLKLSTEITKFNDYYRFSFKSSEYAPFDVLIDGSDVILDFEKANDLELSRYIYNNSIMRAFGSSADQKSFILKLNAEGLKIRKFIADDNTVGFDLFVSGEKSNKKTIMMSSLPEDAIQSGQVKEEKPKEEVRESKARKKLNKFAKTDIITFPPEYIGPPRVEQLYRMPESFFGPPAYDSKQFAVYEIIKTGSGGAIVPDISIDNKGFVLSFPITDIESASAGAISMGDKVRIIMNSVNNIQVAEVIQNPFIKDIKLIPDEKFKIIEITLNKKKINPEQFSQAFYKDKFSWIFEVYSNNDKNKKFEVTPISVLAESNFGERRVVITSEGFVGPILLDDPSTGEKIKAFLVKNNATGIALPREFVDLKFLNSLQGVFIHEKTDLLAYDVKDNKVIVTKLSNLQISDEVISSDIGETAKTILAAAKTRGAFPADSIFPFPLALEKDDKKKKDKKDKDNEAPEESAKAKKTEGEDTEIAASGLDEAKVEEEDEKIIEEEDEINPNKKDITVESLEFINDINAATADKKPDIKFNFAKMYFTKGMYAESLGILQDLKLKDPGYKQMFIVDAIMGVTEYMTGKYGDAYDIFTNLVATADKNKNYNELKLWQWASKERYNITKRNNEDISIDIDFTASFDKFMQKYPINLRYKFGLMYIEDNIRLNKYDEAKSTLDIIAFAGVPRTYLNETKFYRAFFAEKDGDVALSTKIYTKLTENVDDRYVRARSLLELTKSQLLRNEITSDQAIEKFLTSATIWRDDFFEMDIYEIVGHLYIAKQDYMNGLGIWKEMSTTFPETAESVFILGKMRQLFIDLFDTGLAYKLKPLETLKLYFSFRYLTPAGEVGDSITKKVAQFFITADMVDEAIKIVEHQIKFRSFGNEKAKLALWLADININNRDLDGAENATKLIKDFETAPSLIAEKKYKVAMIEALRGRYQKSLDMIRNDFSSPAQKIRTELFWQNENWFGVIATVEGRLNEIRDTRPNPLSKEEALDIKRLMVAYAAQGENKKLASIKAEFDNRINSVSDQLLINYLAEGSKDINPDDFDRTVELEDIERFLNQYTFLPNKNWVNVIKVLEPKVKNYFGKLSDELTREQKLDIINLSMAFAMFEPKDEKEDNDRNKRYANIVRSFKDVVVDRSTIDALFIFDDQFMPKENDAVFEGKIKLADIRKFVDYYKKAVKFSELNISIRNKF